MDLKLVDHYAPLIADALAALVTPAQIRAAIEAAASAVAKDAESDAKAHLADVARAKLAPNADPAALEQVIRQTITDGYLIGGAAARRQLGGNAVTLDGATGSAIADINWDTWQPGDAGAALQAADGGLASLLDSAGVGIKGIVDSSLDDLGNAIADGVGSGLSVDGIASSLSDWATGFRAERIAQTESARAVTAATLASYEANGVNQWNLVLSDGACPECEDVADNGPYPASDSQDAPPVHPMCRCAASPITDNASTDSAGSADDGSGGSGLFGDLAGLVGDASSTVDDLSAALDTASTAADDLTALSDDGLADLLGTAEDDAQIDRITAELDRRDAEARDAEKKAAQAAKSKARRDAAKAAEDDRLNTLYDEALAAGEDPEESYARIYGTTVERMRIDDAMRQLREHGYTGRNFEELAQAAFKDQANEAYLKAEDYCRGHMVNQAGMKADVSYTGLFTGPESRARKYASEDLLNYWQEYGRLTLDDVKASLLGGAMRSAGTAAWA